MNSWPVAEVWGGDVASDGDDEVPLLGRSVEDDSDDEAYQLQREAVPSTVLPKIATHSMS